MAIRSAKDKLLRAALTATALASALGGATTAVADDGTGGAEFAPPPPPPAKATIRQGRAIAPAGAPWRVRHVITAANRLVRKPYRYGGGQRTRISEVDKGYDCSGSVSYALYGGRFLKSPMSSGGLMRWGRRGAGRSITVYTNRGHAFIVVAGLRFDTGMRDRRAGGPSTGPSGATGCAGRRASSRAIRVDTEPIQRVSAQGARVEPAPTGDWKLP